MPLVCFKPPLNAGFFPRESHVFSGKSEVMPVQIFVKLLLSEEGP
jgi:hypothetical protein